MTTVSFTIKGRPVPWQRMRRNGKRYFPAEGQVEAKDAIRAAYRDAVKAKTFSGPCDAVNVDIHAVYALPARLKKGDPRSMGSPHTMKPDADNIAKLVKDALNKVAYEDDCMVSTLTVRKQWSDHFRTTIKLEYHAVDRGISLRTDSESSITKPNDLKRPNEGLNTLAKPKSNTLKPIERSAI